MCVLAFAWSAHPRWPLVMIGNRDELHARPTAPLARWDEYPHLMAGRDLQSGGSWLGVSEEGRFAVVTNLPSPGGPQVARVSRGALVSDTLTLSGQYSDLSADDLDDFNPVNLITADLHSACFHTNRPEPSQDELAPGIYGLSNGLLDEAWPKTERIKAILGSALESGDIDAGDLFNALRADDSPQTEAGQARISPLFIRNAVYGTRCSTVVAIDNTGAGWIAERRYNSESNASGETRIDFQWPAEGHFAGPG